MKSNNTAELDKLVTLLEGLTLTSNGNSRKGGLIGLAATAIALGKVSNMRYSGSSLS